MSELPGQAAYQINGQRVEAQDFYAVACDPRRHVAVEACAGAGKTWMLVSRIVRALLEGMHPHDGSLQVQPHEILAITFTKRAASEMRERLYRWLEEYAHAPPEVLVQELQLRGVRVSGTAALLATARRLAQLYGAVLRSGRQVQIRTFHSWFAALLRAAPMSVLHSLGLPLNYELLEDDTPATTLVWRRFYQSLLERPDRKADYEALVLAHGRSQTDKALSVALDKRVEFVLAEASGVAQDSVQHFAALFPALAGLDEPAAALDQPAARTRWLDRARALGAESTKTPQKAAQAIVEVFAVPDTTVSTADRATRLAALRKAFFVADENRLTQHLKKFPAAQQAEAELQVLCAAQHQHLAWLYQQRMVRLARVLVDDYAALKRERGWVDMTDIERAALVLLSDPVLSGWVQERLDARIAHLLIDEFQDTNPLQWQALLSWLGSYAGAGGTAPRLFIVGDPKQSIYRFRRAEPQVFRAAQQFVVQGLQGDLLSCDHTRRNATEVIATVNAAMGRARADDGFDGFRDHTTGSSETGQVLRLPPIPRPVPLSADGVAGDPLDGSAMAWRDSLTVPREEPEETLRSLEARQVAQWIRGRVDAGLRPQDVMVLSRRRAGLLPMQQELRALGVAAQIGEKTALIDCCEVLDLVALLDVLVSTQHDLSLARVLKSPLFGLPDGVLVALALRRRACGLPWFDVLQEEWPHTLALQGVGATLVRWKSWLDQLPPHDALQMVYSDGDVLARYAVAAPATQRDAVLANLRALLSAALQLGGGRYATPYAFVRALKAGGVQAPAAPDDAAVRLLTIHGAKGLEAEAVVLLDTDTPVRASETMGVLVDWPGEARQPQRLVFLASESRPPACAVELLEAERMQRQREELNALYVALTRARHTLLVSSITPHRDAPDSWWKRLAGLVPEVAVVPVSAPGQPASRPGGPEPFHLKVLPMCSVALPPEPARSPPERDDTPLARLGKAMHRLLEWGAATPDHAGAAARMFALDADQAGEAAAMAQRILAGQGAWVWQDNQVAWQAAELELVYQGQTLRLDRLVQHRASGDWWVLDFKSTSTPQLQPELVDQLQTYRSAVQAIHPGQTVRAAFLTADGGLIELPQRSAA